MTALSSRWKTMLPLGFVGLSLLALVLVPVWTQRQTQSLRDEMLRVTKPARILLTEIELSLALEVSALRGYLISGNATFLERHGQALDREDRASTQLQDLAQTLGPEIRAQVLELHAAELGWRAPTSELLNRRLSLHEYAASLPAQEVLYEKALGVLTQLGEQLGRFEEHQTQRIRDAEQLQLLLTGLLAFLALASALIVGWASARLRGLTTLQEKLANRTAQAAQARDEVLDIVAHDLRSPLDILWTGTRLLRDPTFPAPQRDRQLDLMQRALGQMNRLLQELLDVARIEAGQLDLDARPLEAVSLVTEACAAIRSEAAERSLALEVRIDEVLPPVHADRERLLQVFSNLIGNALRLTPKGGRIRISAVRSGHDVRFSVQDTGPAIGPEDQQRLFAPYWQARSAAPNGAGLGLFVTRGIVQAHHGQIWVDSRRDAGNTFHFTLPVATAPESGG